MAIAGEKVVVLVALDDTDNLESCGTGYHARTIAKSIETQGLGTCVHITRHQLLFSPLVPFTSHNSAACIRVLAVPADIPAIRAYARDYLLAESAEGSDAGLCVITETAVPREIQQFGHLSKRRLLTQQQAWLLAERFDIALDGLTGNHDGVIGALAAVGLHASGCDGRLLWLRGLRELVDQTATVQQISETTGVEVVQTVEGQVLVDAECSIELGSWPRAVLLGGQAVLIVEKGEEDATTSWRVAPKQYLKQF
jgi:tRNA(Ile2) C34 agmatinyltransferase TiaS